MGGRGRALALLAVFALGAGIAVAAFADSSPPVVSTSQTDAVGDAQLAGPDISRLSAAMTADGNVVLALTLQSAISANQLVEFDIETQNGAEVQIVGYPDSTATLYLLGTGGWQPIRDFDATWTGSGTFNATISLDELRNVMHQAVQPYLDIDGKSWVGSNPKLSDSAPDSGWLQLNTVAPTSTTTQAAASGQTPYVTESYSLGKKAHVTWKRFAIDDVPAGSNVTISCLKVCKLFEQLHVTNDIATSKSFVGVPFASGTSFLARVKDGASSGYWFRRTVVGKKGNLITTGVGCIVSSTLKPITSC